MNIITIYNRTVVIIDKIVTKWNNIAEMIRFLMLKIVD